MTSRLEEYRHCPRCLADNDLDSQHCEMCGWNLGVVYRERRSVTRVAVALGGVFLVGVLIVTGVSTDSPRSRFVAGPQSGVAKPVSGPLVVVEVFDETGAPIDALIDQDLSTVWYVMYQPGLTITVRVPRASTVTGIEWTNLATDGFAMHARAARATVTSADDQVEVQFSDEPGAQLVDITTLVGSELTIRLDDVFADSPDVVELAVVGMQLWGYSTGGG